MLFHHLHFYVNDASFWRRWFIRKLAFKLGPTYQHITSVRQGHIEIRLSSPKQTTAAKQYLQSHPAGIADIAFATAQFDSLLQRCLSQGATLLQPPTRQANGLRHCQIKGWAHLRHTLVEVPLSRLSAANNANQQPLETCWLSSIDHVVINVAKGALTAAASWYQKMFGLVPGQQFEIQTARSGLRSQVLKHPHSPLQLPINEPTSNNSQIQEFLDHNRGSGVQHVALRSHDAIGAIARFRQQGLPLLNVPDTYYDQLTERPNCPLQDVSAIRKQQLLLDWLPGGQQGMLLQTFTQPIFPEPTFFFEIIERSRYQDKRQLKTAQGFGEGNFQALFEAIERSQLERGCPR